MTTTKVKVPFIYTRISQDPMGLRAGVRRQLDDSTAALRQRGWSPQRAFEPGHRLYEDNDTSAYKGRRPQFEQMIAELHEAHCLVAYNVDRLVRQPRDLERLIDRCTELGLTRVATAQGDIDLTTHDGRLHARILAAVAAKESDDKSRRVTRVLRDRSERGLWTGNRAPIGYRLSPQDGTLELDHARADLVRGLADEILQGTRTLTDAARDLNITPLGLRKTLLSPTLIGRTGTGHRGYWPPILDDLQQAHLRETFENRRTGPNNYGAHWLSGVLICAVCEHRFSFMGGHQRGSYGCWVCREAPDRRGNTIQALGAELVAAGFVSDAWPKVATRAPKRMVRIDTAHDAATEERLAELARAYVAGEVTRAEWEAARATLADRTLERDVTPPTPLPKDLTPAEWETLPSATKQEMALRLWDGFVVEPARRRGVFDPTRMRPRARS